MPKSGEKKEDKMDEMVGWPDHIITYYIVGKLRLTMGGEIIYKEAFLMSCMYIVTFMLLMVRKLEKILVKMQVDKNKNGTSEMISTQCVAASNSQCCL